MLLVLRLKVCGKKMVEASINRQKTDEEMSMAIDNLSAMLNTENVDEVIELLQQNNWDEQAAA